jgi:hypothetical protein
MASPLWTSARPGAARHLGVLVPATIACVLVTDVTLRLLPHELFSFRAWEALRTPGEEAPFLPNRVYHNDRTYGNLAAIANLSAQRQYRSVTFTTDALGYGNRPGLAARKHDAMVIGSSFAAGSELGDGASLAAQLSGMMESPVYNAGGGDPDIADIRVLAHRLLAPGGAIIYEFPEMREPPPITPVHAFHPTARCRERLAAVHLAGACRLAGWLRRHARVSPLEILGRRAWKILQDGRWLPNPYARLVVLERLRNGQETLFLAEERTRFPLARSERAAVRSFRWLHARLAQERFALIVVLVPHKYTVYQPLLERPDEGPDESASYLNHLEQGLRAAGVPVLNLTAPFRAAAAAELERGAYIYYRDDTHWNPAGAALAAREIAGLLDAR